MPLVLKQKQRNSNHVNVWRGRKKFKVTHENVPRKLRRTVLNTVENIDRQHAGRIADNACSYKFATGNVVLLRRDDIHRIPRK